MSFRISHLLLSSLAFLMLGRAAIAAPTSGHYSNAAGSRNYQIYVPEGAAPAKLPLLVVLHGCFMTGSEMAAGTRLSQLAQQFHFAVIYPEQSYGDNLWKCWNWFGNDNQTRGGGEASIIVGMVQQATTQYNLDASRVYVTGLSAGGAMAANLLACYSDVFAGGLIASGLEYKAATNNEESFGVMKNGSTHSPLETAADAVRCSPKRTKPFDVIIVHGSGDQTVNEVNGEQLYKQFVAIDTAIFTASGGSAQLIQSSTSSMSGAHDPANVETTSFGGAANVIKIVVDGMDHGWSGGDAGTPYMQPDGIDASKFLSTTFFH